MCACSTAKRRRRQARMVNGRKKTKIEMRAMMIAKQKRARD